MTTIEFMQKQLKRHEYSLRKEQSRKPPEEFLENIKKKIEYYTEACEILSKYARQERV